MFSHIAADKEKKTTFMFKILRWTSIFIKLFDALSTSASKGHCWPFLSWIYLILFAFWTGLLISCVWVLLHHALDQTRCSEKRCVVLWCSESYHSVIQNLISLFREPFNIPLFLFLFLFCFVLFPAKCTQERLANLIDLHLQKSHASLQDLPS